MSLGIDWNDAVKKDVKGIIDEDLGKIKGIYNDYLIVERGVANKECFYIPKDEVKSYDGKYLRTNLSEEEVKRKYMRNSPP